MIRAVVLDIGSVLEVVDDTLFPAPFEQRHGLASGTVMSGLDALPGDPGIGEVSEAEVRAEWQRALALSDAQTDELLADFWAWYVGTPAPPLVDRFAAQRPRRRTGILSNSAPGAREAERCWGFEAITDDIVYSHEVGLRKPDPRVFELTAARLGVEPHEVLLLDDVAGHVEAARAQGWHGVVHVDTTTSIAALERIIATEA